MEAMNTNVGTIPVEQMTTVASLALLVYDYLLTLNIEIERLWKRKFYHRLTWSSFLFFINRHLTLLANIPIILELFNEIPIDPVRCRNIMPAYNTALTIVMLVVIFCMMLLRINALYEHRRRVLAFPFILAICSTAITVVAMIKHPPNETPMIQFRCDFGVNTGRAHYLAGAYSGVFTFDVVIFAMTLYRTLTLARENDFGLFTIIIRDGTVYFGVMATTNLANILFLILANPTNRGALINSMTIMSSIMITRLMLNLRDPKLDGDSEDGKLTSIRFNGQMCSGETNDASMNIHCDKGDV